MYQESNSPLHFLVLNYLSNEGLWCATKGQEHMSSIQSMSSIFMSSDEVSLPFFLLNSLYFYLNARREPLVILERASLASISIFGLLEEVSFQGFLHHHGLHCFTILSLISPIVDFFLTC